MGLIMTVPRKTELFFLNMNDCYVHSDPCLYYFYHLNAQLLIGVPNVLLVIGEDKLSLIIMMKF